MQKVTCFHCGNVVRISPDKSLCPECGEDLQHLLDPDFVASYFHSRARELADQGDATAALAQIERGLTYAAGAELHLLAAILAQQIGRYDLMRHHVAAIAVDDTLRPEAEWLLRSHQARQRALRGQPQPAGPLEGASALLDDLLGRNQDAAAPPMRPLQALWPALAVMAILGLAALVYMAFGGADRLPQTADVSHPRPTPQEPGAAAGATQTPSVEPDLLPTPTLTPDIPNDVVQGPTAAIADSSPRPVVIIEADRFDLAGYLRRTGHPELAELGVDALLQGTTLLLRGVVQLDQQRRALLDAVATAPGVTEVNAVDLLLRPLPTYVVQEGDTLWTIMYNIYGNADRMQELIDLNLEVMPSPELLSPGMELKIPPLQ
ncbi:MAG: LysM peptidoglycan-binding domain-containing protein [Caldilineaceae bacterium]|nr:LysM peptidoglycan-binding domain-containing protein [Caldilineaceae bacterium]